MLTGFRAIAMRHIMVMAVLAIFALPQTVWAGASGSYPKASYNGLLFPSYSLNGAIIEKSWEDDDWTRTLNWNGRLEPGSVLRITGTAKREGGSGPGVVNGRLKVTVEVDGVASAFNKDLIGNDQVVSFDVSRPIGARAKEGRVLVELYGIYGNGQTRNIKLGGVFTNAGAVPPPLAKTSPAKKPPQNPNNSGARFGGVSGQVEVSHDGGTTWSIAKIDTPLLCGDHIKTDEDASAILSFADMSTFVLHSESEIILAQPSEPESKLKLVVGNIVANIKHIVKYGSMEVECSQAVTAIKGTTFELWENGKNASAIKVTAGLVSFRHKKIGKTVMVGAGQTYTATPTDIVPGNRIQRGHDRIKNNKPTSGGADKEPVEIFRNGDDGALSNGASPALFVLQNPTTITSILSVHYNNGQGAAGGTLQIKGENQTSYGKWPVEVMNEVYWIAKPNVTLPAGRYWLIDSDPSTWSQNAGSNGQGHIIIKGVVNR